MFSNGCFLLSLKLVVRYNFVSVGEINHCDLQQIEIIVKVIVKLVLVNISVIVGSHALQCLQLKQLTYKYLFKNVIEIKEDQLKQKIKRIQRNIF